MTDSERPWWSSGSGPDTRVEPGPAADDRQRRERDRQVGDERLGDATGSRHTTSDAGGNGTGGSHATNGHHEHTAHAAHDAGLGPGEVCQVCPICTALRLVGEVRPDLLVHLAEAARHLTLAAKTMIDAQASGFGGGGLQHIPLDDDPS